VTKRNRSETYCSVRYWRKDVRYRVGATLYVTDKSRHHARNSCFLVVKTCGQAKQSILYLLVTSKTTCTSVLAVMLCEVVLSYPAPDRQKPPPRTQFLVSGCGNLWTGQTKHSLPVGHFKNDLSNCCCRHVVSSCRELPWSRRTKTVTTPAILAFQLRKLMDRPNKAFSTCWSLQKRRAQVFLR
jgi:hypothetical protein